MRCCLTTLEHITYLTSPSLCSRRLLERPASWSLPEPFLLFPPLCDFCEPAVGYSVRGHLRRALTCTVLTIAVTVPLVAWANHLPSHQPNDGIHWDGVMFLVWSALIVLTLTSWTVVAVAAGRRIQLSKAMLTTEAILAASVAVAMVTMVVATAVWWGAMATDAPTFLNASPAGLPGSSWDILLIATVALMAVAAGTAAVGLVREVRLWKTMRAG